jgi:hypothetical protein
MNQPSILLETDPLLRQSVEALGTPEPLAVRLPEKLGKKLAVAGLAAVSILGISESRESNVAEANAQGGLAANQVVCQPTSAQPGEAVVVNVTPVQNRVAGYGTVGPSGVDIGSSSIVNFNGTGEANPNLAVVPVNADKELCYGANQAGDVIFDVFGYLPSFRAATSNNTAKRILDTRESNPISFDTKYNTFCDSSPDPILDIFIPNNTDSWQLAVVYTALQAPTNIILQPKENYGIRYAGSSGVLSTQILIKYWDGRGYDWVNNGNYVRQACHGASIPTNKPPIIGLPVDAPPAG